MLDMQVLLYGGASVFKGYLDWNILLTVGSIIRAHAHVFYIRGSFDIHFIEEEWGMLK